jgi:hypothetical protein
MKEAIPSFALPFPWKMYLIENPRQARRVLPLRTGKN